MKRFTTILLTTALTGSAALAVTGVADVDLDNDDFVSFEELSAAYPGITPLNFEEMDDNDDNRLNSTEMYSLTAQNILARHDPDPQVRVDVDTDNDGFASYEEMAVVFEGLTPGDFEEMDNNDDNRLSQFEIYDLESQTILARYPFMESVADVQQIDIDGDRFLNFMELRIAYPGLSDIEFEEMDQNDDNRISFTELYAPDAQTIVSRYES
jgi:hypothetical protein